MKIDVQIKRLEAAANFCKELTEIEASTESERKNNQLKLKYAKQQKRKPTQLIELIT